MTEMEMRHPLAGAAIAVAQIFVGIGLLACEPEIRVGMQSSQIVIDPPITRYDYELLDELEIKVYNTGVNRTLTIQDVRLDYTPATEEERTDPDGPALRVAVPVLPFHLVPFGEGWEFETVFKFTVKAKHYNDCETRDALLTIVNDNNTDAASQNLTIVFDDAIGPRLSTSGDICFDASCGSSCAGEEVRITNTGRCVDLEVVALAFSGTATFQLEIAGTTYHSGSDSGVAIDPPIIVPPKQSVVGLITYRPEGPSSYLHWAELTVVSTDPVSDRTVTRISVACAVP